jgi:hypothetical protein
MQNGTLFTEDFLLEGIRQTPDWKEFGETEREALAARLRAILAPFHAGATHNEADTEERVIYRVLGALGWEDLILRKNTLSPSGKEDVPDALLLPDKEALARAALPFPFREMIRYHV